MKHKIAAACIWFAIANPVMAQKPDKEPSVLYDQYTKTTTIVGQMHSHNALLDPVKTVWWLTSAIVDNQPHAPLLILDVDMPNWAFFDRAHDIDGNSLIAHQIQRRLSDLAGDVHETVGAELPLDYVIKHANIGMNIRFDGERGNYVIIVPSQSIIPFLKAYEKQTGIKIFE